MEVANGYALTSGDLPTLEDAGGATFGGWFYDSELTDQATVGDIVSEDLTLYAKWN